MSLCPNPEPTLDADFRVIVAELERVKAENRALTARLRALFEHARIPARPVEFSAFTCPR